MPQGEHSLLQTRLVTAINQARESQQIALFDVNIHIIKIFVTICITYEPKPENSLKLKHLPF
jgi:hypothetical protein